MRSSASWVSHPAAALSGRDSAMAYDPVSTLVALEPEAARLLDRHLKVAQEWFPHEYIPYALGRNFDKDPWTPSSRASRGSHGSRSRSTS